MKGGKYEWRKRKQYRRRGKYERRRETDCRRGIGTHNWRRRGTLN